MTDACKYRLVCKNYYSESYTCNESPTDRQVYCGCYHSLERQGKQSKHHRPLKDSWLIKLLRQFRK
jgi:predicted adenine nucleotide alpha hydrolase (AANH) superfamily ATPase